MKACIACMGPGELEWNTPLPRYTATAICNYRSSRAGSVAAPSGAYLFVVPLKCITWCRELVLAQFGQHRNTRCSPIIDEIIPSNIQGCQPCHLGQYWREYMNAVSLQGEAAQATQGVEGGWQVVNQVVGQVQITQTSECLELQRDCFQLVGCQA